MKVFHGKTFYTLAEAISAFGTEARTFIPANVKITLTINGVAVNLGALYASRFAGYYLAKPIGSDAEATTVDAWIQIEGAAATAIYKQQLLDKIKLATDFVNDSETETLEYKRAPTGGTDFSKAFSNGGTLRNKLGGSSGNVDRLLRYQNEIGNAIDEFLDAFERFFIGVLTDWGVDVEV